MNRVACVMIAVLALMCQTVVAQDKDKPDVRKIAKDTVKPEVVVTGLDNPTGVAVQPETGIVFVADSAAGQIIRVVGNKAQPVITDFPIDTYGKGPVYSIGPLGLAFINKNTLVVGGGGNKDGEELLRIYRVPDPNKTIKADDMLHKLGPIAVKDGVSTTVEGNFHGVAVSKKAIYSTSNGDDTKGWVAKVDLENDEIKGELEPYLATKVATGVDAPVAIALDPNGHLVVGQMGEIDKPNDSLLTFYSSTNGRKMLNLRTNLSDIAGLAYSTVTGRLYAVDFAWKDASRGGLFRLEREFKNVRQGCTSAKIASLDKPTALAFGPDGTLYVTEFGTARRDSKEKPGRLLKFAKGL
jgi:sugar lactone lactonase YvrE